MISIPLDSNADEYSYLYGGIGAGETALHDLYILTLPAFRWISVCMLGVLTLKELLTSCRCTQISSLEFSQKVELCPPRIPDDRDGWLLD
jgi:hypothetical protein